MQLLIRADASARIGTGHIMRCLALAQVWQQTYGGVTFAVASITPALRERLQLEGVQVQDLQSEMGSEADAQETLELARTLGAPRLVIDGYHFKGQYQRSLKQSDLRVLLIDDYGHSDHYSADLVLNQNSSAREDWYDHRDPQTELLLGTTYTLLRQEFCAWAGFRRQTPAIARNVLVTLGGADPENVTLTVIQALQQIDLEALNAIVVVGGSNPHYQELVTVAAESQPPITLRRNVVNMPELLAWAEVAVAAGGTTSWELALMGLPSLVLVLADNQQAIAAKLEQEQVAINLGWYADVSVQEIATALKQLLTSPEKRLAMTQLSQALVDGYGSIRVANALAGS